MREGMLNVFTGDGHGKSPAAFGEALLAASEGKRVIIIQFLKKNSFQESAFMKRLEPEIRFFRFEKSDEDFINLSEERKEEEVQNIRNGVNFAKKALNVGDCDLLILDEVLGLVDMGIIKAEELLSMVEAKPAQSTVILTGIQLNDKLLRAAAEVSRIEPVRSTKIPLTVK